MIFAEIQRYFEISILFYILIALYRAISCLRYTYNRRMMYLSAGDNKAPDNMEV